ncbi:unnamed protein product, partial [Porites evermanni]
SVSLSPADLDNSVVVKLLKAEYKRRSQLRPLLWESTIELPLEDVYTRLKIVSRRKADFRVDDDEVNVFDIFTALDKGEDFMTLVEGSPGIGKTTFCLKLAYDWACGKIPAECSFPKFELVLLLKCRDIHEGIMETISEQLLPEDIEEKTKERLFCFIKDIHNQEKTLIILDGLDEVPQESEHYVHKLLQRRILSFCYVLATSRQERGIDVRKKFRFGILLEISGFTESDAFEYIRKHFRNVGPLHSLKGESLIKEINENTLLHGLLDNPLNLLLLCVIYEDYEGSLPSSRTELYQVIVLCLLRRYCAKRDLEAPKDSSGLEKQFKESLLTLGELAWICLLSDRYCFREDELAELEKRYNGLVARELGLLYKEERLKRLEPQNEYCFLHKTFQEYVAAAYIAEKLVNQQFNVFEHICFDDFVTKYPEVFIFVSGMLGQKATVLFTQIGEKLKEKGDWDWNKHCREEAATFFTQSLSESGHAEQMAASVCDIIPFPRKILVNDDRSIHNEWFPCVLNACRMFSNLQTPVELYADCFMEYSEDLAIKYIESCSQLTTVCLVIGSLTSSYVGRLCKCFAASASLSEFTLKLKYGTNYDLLVQIGRVLALCPNLTKVTFSFFGSVYSEDFFHALETGVAPLTSVSPVTCSIYPNTWINVAGNFFCPVLVENGLHLKQHLTVNIWGEMSCKSTKALFEVLAPFSITFLKLNVHGNLTSDVANSIARCLEEGKTLSFLSINIWGELTTEGGIVLSRLANSNLSVQVNVHDVRIGPDESNNVLDINIDNPAALKAFFAEVKDTRKKKVSVTINNTNYVIKKWINCLGNALAESTSLTSLDLTVNSCLMDADLGECLGESLLQSTSLKSLSLRINCSNMKEGWQCKMGDCFARMTSLTSLSLELNDYGAVDSFWNRVVGDCLRECTSLKDLSLTFRDNDYLGYDCYGLDNGLAKTTSVNTLSLSIWVNNLFECYSDDFPLLDLLKSLNRGLSLNSSITTLTITVIVNERVFSDWPWIFSDGLSVNKSVTTLNLAINECGAGESDIPGLLLHCGVFEGLAQNTSVTMFNLTLNSSKEVSDDWLPGLCDALKKNTSLTTLGLKVNNHCST